MLTDELLHVLYCMLTGHGFTASLIQITPFITSQARTPQRGREPSFLSLPTIPQSVPPIAFLVFDEFWWCWLVDRTSGILLKFFKYY